MYLFQWIIGIIQSIIGKTVARVIGESVVNICKKSKDVFYVNCNLENKAHKGTPYFTHGVITKVVTMVNLLKNINGNNLAKLP